MLHTHSILHDFAINNSTCMTMQVTMSAVLAGFSYPGEGNIQIITGLSQKYCL